MSGEPLRWEDHYEALANWAKAHGHARPGHGELVDGFDIGRWTSKQRVKIRAGKLDSDRTARLRAQPGWLDHTIEALWPRCANQRIVHARGRPGRSADPLTG